MSELAVIVDEHDNKLGLKPRKELGRGDSIRISSVILFNERQEVLLAKRSMTKSNDPGKWGPSAAGTVEPNETFATNACKELEEEIGVTGVNLTEARSYHF